MEAGGPNPSNEFVTESSQPGKVVTEGNATATANIENLQRNPQQGPIRHDINQYLPMSSVVRMMRNILPPHAKIADDAKETVQECVSEFINFITSEALEECHREYRKKITPEDVIGAMGSLGFHNYVEPLSVFLSRHRSLNPGQSSSSQAPASRGHTGGVVQQQRAPPVSLAAPPLPPPTTTPLSPPLLDELPQDPMATPALPKSYLELPQMNEHRLGNPRGGQGRGEGSSSDSHIDALN